MQKKFNLEPRDLKVGLGPAIRACCYEVGKEFEEFGLGLIKKDNRYFIDLIGANKRQILDTGVRQANIYDCGICTSCQSNEFFSYRKEKEACGRMIAVAMLL